MEFLSYRSVSLFDPLLSTELETLVGFIQLGPLLFLSTGFASILQKETESKLLKIENCTSIHTCSGIEPMEVRFCISERIWKHKCKYMYVCTWVLRNPHFWWQNPEQKINLVHGMTKVDQCPYLWGPPIYPLYLAVSIASLPVLRTVCMGIPYTYSLLRCVVGKYFSKFDILTTKRYKMAQLGGQGSAL